jgi:hypothetical protein
MAGEAFGRLNPPPDSAVTRDSLSSNIDTLLSILNFEMFAIISMFLCLHLSNAFKVNYYSNHKSMALHMITPKDAFDIGEIAISFVSYIDSDKEWMKSLDKFRKKIVSPFANHKSSFDYDVKTDPYYVKRPSVESQIRMVYDNRDNSMGDYHIVYGVKGAGKSYIVASELEGKEGVIRIDVSQGDTAISIISKIAKICGLTLTANTVSLSVFNPILKEAKVMRSGLPLTFVFEVERGSSSRDVVSLVKQVSKVLALKANVLIVLSEANAVLGFGEDKRQQFLYVDGMEVLEAEEYAKKKYPTIQDHDIQNFIDKIGTLPLDVGLFCKGLSKGVPADTLINGVIAEAKKDLIAFTHTPILKALKNQPDGVSIEKFRGIEDKGVLLSEPKYVGVAMKVRNVIVYHFQSGEYRLFSKAHKTAIKDYEF